MRLTMKAGKSSATAMVLPSFLTNSRHARTSDRSVGDAADQLDQLHHRHRIHEMNADEALRPVGRRGSRVIEIDDGVGAD
jgi:hypothetical protein